MYLVKLTWDTMHAWDMTHWELQVNGMGCLAFRGGTEDPGYFETVGTSFHNIYVIFEYWNPKMIRILWPQVRPLNNLDLLNMRLHYLFIQLLM